MFKEELYMWFQIVMMVVQMAMQMKQASDQKKAAQKQAQAAVDAKAKEQWDLYEENEKKRKDLLKKALAKKRAKLGASGFSAADGSAGAIVQGLRTDAAEESYDDFMQKSEALNESISGIQSSLLQQSDAAKRKLYSQVGSSLGAIGGSMMGSSSGMGAQYAQIGSSAGGAIGDMLGGS